MVNFFRVRNPREENSLTFIMLSGGLVMPSKQPPITVPGKDGNHCVFRSELHSLMTSFSPGLDSSRLPTKVWRQEIGTWLAMPSGKMTSSLSLR